MMRSGMHLPAVVSLFAAALPAPAVEQLSRLDPAEKLGAESALHARMAAAFEKSPSIGEQKFPMSGKTAGHCRWLSEKLAKQAARARAQAGRADLPDKAEPRAEAGRPALPGEAALLEAEARVHARVAAEFEKSPAVWEQKWPMSGRTAAHCRWLSEKRSREAQQLRARIGR